MSVLRAFQTTGIAVFPRNIASVIREAAGEREIAMMSWGFIWLAA
jgi:hypothetical protein